MKVSTYASLLIAAIAGLSAGPSAAQTSGMEDAFARSGTEIRASFTIPFGTERSDHRADPRLSFGVRQNFRASDRTDQAWLLRAERSSTGTAFVDSEFSMTLTQTPQFALNGQAITFPKTARTSVSDEVQTAGKVALGAGLVTLAVGATVVGIYLIGVATDDGPFDDG